MERVTTLIRAVITTLNGVEVKGKDNLDGLLGSINALESIVQILEVTAAPEEKKEEANG